MNDYIDRAALKKRFQKRLIWLEKDVHNEYSKGLFHGYETDMSLIDEIPAADVVEVRHGRWIPSESDFDDDDTLFDVEDWCDWQCSVCREDICYEDPMERRFLPKFCPACGAPMMDQAVDMMLERLEALKNG